MSDRVVEAIQSAGALHPISDVATMSERVSRSTSRARLSFVFAAILAATALALGSVGLYGVLSFDVSQRRREFGVRLALGATAARVRLLVLRDGLPLVLAGLAIGIASAWILIHTATSVLYGITPADVPPYAIGALVVALCSGTALWLPIRRASAVDPAVALRQD